MGLPIFLLPLLFITVSIYVFTLVLVSDLGDSSPVGRPEPHLSRKMKKHSREEILSKLTGQMNLLAQEIPRSDVCKALGRERHDPSPWRKLPLRKAEKQVFPRITQATPGSLINPPTVDETRHILEELKLENQRLRKIVTDLLLEKMRLEEAAVAASSRQSADARV